MTHQPKNLEKWYCRINYTGDNFDSYYVAFMMFHGQSQSSRAKYQYIKDHLEDCGALDGDVIYPEFTDDVLVRRYYILVKDTSDRALKMADMFADRIKRRGLPIDFHLNYAPMTDVASRGNFSALWVPEGSGIVPTTITSRRKTYAREKEAAKKRSVILETHKITGSPVKVVARSLDGIVRRWMGVKPNMAD